MTDIIIIHAYNPSWPEQFVQVRQLLQDALGGLALRVDHIGSTAVPNLDAKDVIDTQVTVANLTNEVRDRLIAAGFDHKDWGTHDHVPRGEDESPDLWRKMLFREPKGRRRINLHVRIAGNPNQRYALLFRDYLRAHPNSVQTLSLIKHEIVKRHADDVETYYDIKDPVYDLIWDAAQSWAEQTGWSSL